MGFNGISSPEDKRVLDIARTGSHAELFWHQNVGTGIFWIIGLPGLLPPAGQNLFEKRFRHLQKLLLSRCAAN
jgi:hypothetical protein